MSNLTHDAAIDAICNCASSVSVLSYQEAIEGYFKLRGLLIPHAPSLAAQDIVDCETCCGSGEVVTDWDRYKHPHDGDVGDEAVADCPDCDGNGKIEVPSLAAQDGLVDALEVIAAGEGCMNGIREELSADALRKIARNALSAIKGDK